jgi:hypothetical protein
MKAAKLFAAVALCALPALALAQEERPYTNGPVTQVTYVRVKPGHFDDYMRHLAGLYRKQMEAFRKEGLVVDYKVLSATPRSPTEPDVVLTVTYPNMAALDRSRDFDRIGTQVAGTFSEQNKAFADRGSIRDVIGSELLREMLLK